MGAIFMGKTRNCHTGYCPLQSMSQHDRERWEVDGQAREAVQDRVGRKRALIIVA